MPIHIEAERGDVADNLILVGDPERAQYIAENYLTDVKCYTKYRLMYGFTGNYMGKRVSVQTAGMGSPSVTIIVEELNMLGVKEIVRLGTCGSISADLKLGDVFIATAAHSSHDLLSRVFPGGSFSAAPDFGTTASLVDAAVRSGVSVENGPVLSSETFYEDNFDIYKKYADYGTKAVEMEAFALFYLGAKYNIKTAAVLTVSDIVFEKKRADKPVIRAGVDNSIKITLEHF